MKSTTIARTMPPMRPKVVVAVAFPFLAVGVIVGGFTRAITKTARFAAASFGMGVEIGFGTRPKFHPAFAAALVFMSAAVLVMLVR